MREILFRGKWGNNGEWGYGLLTQTRKLYVIFNHDEALCYEVDNATIGQYTGLKDKNGVKIFEGDILAFYDSGFERRRYVVAWDDEQAGFVYGKSTNFYHADLENTEVIGNIHDNPELLEKKNG